MNNIYKDVHVLVEAARLDVNQCKQLDKCNLNVTHAGAAHAQSISK
jgi:hypothetical protein